MSSGGKDEGATGSETLIQGNEPMVRPSKAMEAQAAATAATGIGPSTARPSTVQEIIDAEPEQISPGTMLGEYEVTKKLGEGGMGEVWGAVHPIIGKKVAVKVLSNSVASNREVVRRFVDEARAVNQIGHSSIVDVFSFGQHTDGRHYYVMEHLDGCSLEDEIEERDILPVEEIVDIFVQTLDALQAAHDKGIIHRDLKPDNIFLTRDARGRGIKLLDFGIAKLSGDEVDERSRTRTGVAMGTPDYMSPEQCQGTKIDLRTDIYAMGVMLYRMMTGHFPFEGLTSPLELFFKVLNEEPPKPSAHVAIPKAFEFIILKCMSKKREDRFGSAKDLSDALVAALESPGELVSAADEAESESELEVEGKKMTAVGDQDEDTPALAAAASHTDVVRVQEPAPSDASGDKGNKMMLLAGVAVLAIGGGAMAVMMGGDKKEPRPTEATPTAAGQPLEQQPTPPPTDTPALAVDAGTADLATPTQTTPPDAGAVAAEQPAKILTGTLQLNLRPSKAEVFLDGESVGTGSQVVIEELAPGEHEIEVRAKGYVSESLDIEIEADETTKKSIRLDRERRSGSSSKPGGNKPGGDKPADKTPEKVPDLVKDKDTTLDWK